MVTNLKMRRIQLGIKQKDLAEKVGITSQYLMMLEKGKAKNPSLEIMKNLSTELNSTVQELFFEQDTTAIVSKNN